MSRVTNTGSTGCPPGSNLEDSLATGRAMQYRPSVELPQPIENLRRVLLGKENDLVARRAAMSTLQKMSEPEAAVVLKKFAESGMSLEDPIVVPPYSPDGAR